MSIGAQLDSMLDRLDRLEKRLEASQQVATFKTPEELRILAPTVQVRTPEYLAAKLETTAETVRRIERGAFYHERAETWAMADRIANELGIPRETYRRAVIGMRNAYIAKRSKRF